MNTTSNVLTELNVESRTILAFRVDQAQLQAFLPAGWRENPPQTGPSKGSNVNVIFSERLLVQNAAGEALIGQAVNHIAVVAIPAQHIESGRIGVMISFGLSGREEGAPGPYGVFLPSESYVERIWKAGPADSRQLAERWSFSSQNGDSLNCKLQYPRSLPTRSTSQTVAYSAKDPDFYRVYDADQSLDILSSTVTGSGDISAAVFESRGPRLAALFMRAELISVASQPWIVRRVFVPCHAAVLQLQGLDPGAYAFSCRIRRRTLWVDSPVRPRENGSLAAGEQVWIDKKLPENAVGMCKVKLADNQLRYIVDVGSLTIE
jgi:hypothetical protein